MPIKSSKLVRHSASFLYAGKEIQCSFWSNDTPGTTPDTVLFLGTGQVGKIPKWIAGKTPFGVVVVEGLPHWHSDPSGEDLKEFTQLYTESVFRDVLDKFRTTRMHIIGVSQATPGTVWLANSMSENIKNVALVLPMGLTTNILGSTDRERFKELRKRSIQTLLQPGQSPFHDFRNIYIAALLTKIVVAGIPSGSTVNKYTAGISQDLLADFESLIATQEKYKRHVSLLIGAEDKIFPAHEIKQALAEAALDNVDMLVVPKLSHSSLAIKSSQQVVDQAINTVRNVKLANEL
ncbi:MAG: hypothetical protein ACQR33_05735 [Candidatus Saccharibacteria bacterium]